MPSPSEKRFAENRLRYTFGKGERLKSKKLIEALFETGRSADVSFLKVIWVATDLELAFPALAAFSVSKKKFAKAVDRNRLKRLMREAYRLQKNELYGFLQEKDKRIVLMFIYTGRKKTTFSKVKKNLSALLEILKERL